jgi:hypothetical protein
MAVVVVGAAVIEGVPAVVIDDINGGRISVREPNIWKSALILWQQILVARLETALGRELLVEDLDCIAWNAAARTLTVQTLPLLHELRSRNLISNVFRT